MRRKEEIVKKLRRKVNEDIIKTHPTATRWNGEEYVPVRYIPIAVIEDLADEIFGHLNWAVTIKDVQTISNSIYVVVTITIKYLDETNTPTTYNIDGCGAVAITDDPTSVQKGLPTAKTFAIKNALEHLSKSFGRDINRSDFDKVNIKKDKNQNNTSTSNTITTSIKDWL